MIGRNSNSDFELRLLTIVTGDSKCSTRSAHGNTNSQCQFIVRLGDIVVNPPDSGRYAGGNSADT